MARVLRHHFVTYDLSTSDADLHGAVTRLYRSFDARAAFPERATTVTLRIERGGLETKEAGTYVETHLCGGPCYFAEGRFSARCADRHEVVVDLPRRFIRIVLGSPYDDDIAALGTQLLKPLFQGFIPSFFGLTALHGATLAVGRHGIVLGGAGGAGKTTTAIHLAQHRFRLLSDDGAYFTSVGGTAYALSSLDCLHVSEQTIALFPSLRAGIVGGKTSRGKYLVAKSALESDLEDEPAEVRDWVLLDRGPTPRPTLTATDRGDLFRHLVREAMMVFRPPVFRDGPSPFREYSEALLELFATLTAQVQVHRLSFADHDLPRVAQLLRAVIA